MFTGLIEAMGSVRAVEKSSADWLLWIRCGFPVESVRLGDSIAVSGVCLTVVDRRASTRTLDELAVQVSAKTLEVTTLGKWSVGTGVNLERALRLGDRLDGHLVQGHVDGVGRVERVVAHGRSMEIGFRVSGATGRYIISKGSIAVDGVSLTVNTVEDGGEMTRFSINVIPHTQRKTTLSQVAPGHEVNVETDLLGRYVERLLGKGLLCGSEGRREVSRQGVDLAFLQQKGF
ncbi:MAG: riboflavin synthase [Magnetococcus sp. YQC-5]